MIAALFYGSVVFTGCDFNNRTQEVSKIQKVNVNATCFIIGITLTEKNIEQVRKRDIKAIDQFLHEELRDRQRKIQQSQEVDKTSSNQKVGRASSISITIGVQSQEFVDLLRLRTLEVLRQYREFNNAPLFICY